MCDFCHTFILQFHCHLLHCTYHNVKSRPLFPRNLGENACAQSVVVSSVCVHQSTAQCPTSLCSQSLCWLQSLSFHSILHFHPLHCHMVLCHHHTHILIDTHMMINLCMNYVGHATSFPPEC